MDALYFFFLFKFCRIQSTSIRIFDRIVSSFEGTLRSLLHNFAVSCSKFKIIEFSVIQSVHIIFANYIFFLARKIQISQTNS